MIAETLPETSTYTGSVSRIGKIGMSWAGDPFPSTVGINSWTECIRDESIYSSRDNTFAGYRIKYTNTIKECKYT